MRFSSLSFNQRLRGGLWVSSVVIACLVFIPPLVADQISIWRDAPAMVAADPRTIERCGAGARVELSRWFYTYKFSGEWSQARFTGSMASGLCKQRFYVVPSRDGGAWQIDQLAIERD